MASITTGFSLDLPWYDEQRIAQLALISLAAVGCLFSLISRGGSYQRITPPSSTVAISLFVFFLLGLCSAATAELPRLALLEWARCFLLYVLVMQTAAVRIEIGETADRMFILAVTSAVALYAFGRLVAYSAFLIEGLPLLSWQFFNGFSNVRFFGQFQTLTLPLLAFLVLRLRNRAGALRLVAFLLFTFWWTLAFASGTRGTWLGLLVAAMALGTACGEAGRRWAGYQLLAAAAGFLFYVVLFRLVPGWLGASTALITRTDNLSGLSLREVIWGAAIGMMLDAPLLGVGPMHFAATPNGVGAHPHSALLQFAAEWGVPATLGLVLAIGTSLKAFWKRLRSAADCCAHSEADLRVALLAALVAGLVQAQVDGVFVVPYTETLLAFVAGWALGVHQGSSFERTTRPGLRLGLVQVSIGVIAVAMVWICALPELVNLESRTAEQAAKYGYLLPRFWAAGWIP